MKVKNCCFDLAFCLFCCSSRKNFGTAGFLKANYIYFCCEAILLLLLPKRTLMRWFHIFTWIKGFSALEGGVELKCVSSNSYLKTASSHSFKTGKLSVPKIRISRNPLETFSCAVSFRINEGVWLCSCVYWKSKEKESLWRELKEESEWWKYVIHLSRL